MPDEQTDPSTKVVRTIDLTPAQGEMVKPAETIDIIGTEALTLQDRRVWNVLIDNAFGPDLAEEGKEFQISVAALRDSHRGNERLEDTIERLMKTVVRCKLGGVTRRFQLLGGNDMADTDRSHGYLTYSFDRRLASVLKSSTMFGKLEKAIMYAFQSKYALALYEYVSRRINMRFKYDETHTVEEFRAIMGVPEGRLKAFGSLKQKALNPALEEVNALAPFRVGITAEKVGNKVARVKVTWFPKDNDGRKEAFAELNRSRVGRKARIRGQVEAAQVYDLSDRYIDQDDS